MASVKKLIHYIKKAYREHVMFQLNDPIKNCHRYRLYGCSHVDGILCDYPHCTMNREFIDIELKNAEN